MTENEELAFRLYRARGGDAATWHALDESTRTCLLLEVVVGHFERAGVQLFLKAA